jgi:hypothetical protein
MKLKTKDKFEITQLCARYLLAVDTNNLQAYLSTWTENGVMEASYGAAKGHAELKEKFVSMNEGMAKGKRHILTNIIIEGEGSKVNVTSYLLIVERESIAKIVATGIYHDEVIKLENKWLFEKRHLQVDQSYQPSPPLAHA